MPLDSRSLQARLAEKGVLVGLMQTYPNPQFTELAGLCGYDFIIFDCEHGLFADADILISLQVARSAGIAGVVRPRNQDGQAIGRYLDMGTDGLLIPNVSTVDEARVIVAATDYPPRGTRGFAASAHRVSQYGMMIEAHKAHPRGDQFVAVLIESAEGVSNLDAILAVDGIDAAFIGPADLSAALGGVGDYTNPAFGEAFIYLERAARAHGKIAGAAPAAVQNIDELVASGHRLFIVGGDASMMRTALAGQLDRTRAALSLSVPQEPKSR